MSDIKMSEVFELPVRTEDKYSCRQFIWSDMGLAGSYGEFNNKRQSDAACHAINNHDRLVEENAQLKADKAELVELIEVSCDRLDRLDSWIESQRSYEEWVNMDELEKRLAKSVSHLYKLIKKHKEPNNEK